MKEHYHTCVHCNIPFKCCLHSCADYPSECPRCLMWLVVLEECEYLEWVIKNA